MLQTERDALIWKLHGETIRIEPWGKNALRVRARLGGNILLDLPNALLEPERQDIRISADGQMGFLTNGKISVEIRSGGGWRHDRAELVFKNQHGDTLLRSLSDPDPAYDKPHRYQSMGGEDFRLSCAFDSEPKEKLYGMGQYQREGLNLKGCMFELAQQNTQASVPFVYSDRGYGFLWNNPAVGQAIFARNKTCWIAESTRQLDYWICAGDTPAEVHALYMRASGLPPRMPEWGLGFWQSKARYWNQEQVLDVAREYHRRGIPVDVMVIDYFHWPYLGDFRFDETLFPDPAGMAAELRAMGMEPMVSVWTPIDERSENFAEMRDRDLLVTVDHGIELTTRFFDADAINADLTNPDTRAFIWDKLREHYLDTCGIRLFWLDEAEPTYTRCDYENYRYALGPAQQISNLYPQCYSRMISEGLAGVGESASLHLVRCAWAGSQRYGALVWSGDIPSTWEALRNQVSIGQQMGMAGIPWWTTDIGGFKGGFPDDPAFRELLTRWMQWGVFCPVMRLHGCREPQTAPLSPKGEPMLNEGAPNEIWSYGEETEKRLIRCIRTREMIRGYIRFLMDRTHETGEPLIRPLFFDFPEDPECWEKDDQHLFGPDVLVAPVLEAGAMYRMVYLPAGAEWTNMYTGEICMGGQTLTVPVTMECIPVYLRDGRHEGWIRQVRGIFDSER